MEPLIITVLVLTAASAEVIAMVCNLSVTNGTHQCYAAFGESLSLQLPQDSMKKNIYLQKGDQRILHFNPGHDWRTKLQNEYVNRSEFYENGTFRLDRVMKNDSGDYRIDIYGLDGILLRKVNIKLEIQAPVSEPVLYHLCLSHGETMVTCSSEGDGLQFSWTLKNQNLTRSLTNSVKLNMNDIGRLTCTVRNEVSSSNSTMNLPACQASSSQFNFVAVVPAVTLTVLLVLYTHLNKKRSRCDTSESGNNEDVVYADVKINKQRRQTNKQPSATKMMAF